ncbi:Scr1 family TA system antitoxin-like transcriptional regulator [Nonomuraea diastatica]|uniref:Scr1 family TA system antitoxin-like transcriptional regulator n=1 Tax=Nonomuraea diastatica TaxID=1848329 RepID=UPI003CCC6B51
MRRQRVLMKDPPLDYSVVLDEAVPRRRFGKADARVTRDQMSHLVKLCDLPNITVRVLRLEEPHPTDIANFMLFGSPSVPVLGNISGEVVYCENHPSFTLSKTRKRSCGTRWSSTRA